MEYTKGEWYTHHNDYNDTYSILANGSSFTLAEVPTYVNDLREEKEEAKANAHLMASAPELYKALQMARDLLFIIAEDHVGGLRWSLSICDKALASARGEE